MARTSNFFRETTSAVKKDGSRSARRCRHRQLSRLLSLARQHCPRMPPDETTRPLGSPPISSAVPSRGARVLAFASILVGGLCGGLIGFSVTRLECVGDCTTNKSVGALIGAVVGALGVAVIAVLALRAMGEWKTIQDRDERQAPSNESRRNPSA